MDRPVMFLKRLIYSRRWLWLVCIGMVLRFYLSHIWSTSTFKETNKVHKHASAKDSPPVDLADTPANEHADKQDGGMDGSLGLSSHKSISLINRRNISVPSTLSVDERFREEIAGYQQMALVPADCAAHTNTVPPPSVKSQDVYANCPSPRVPNIMHMVWLYGRDHTFNFIQYLSGLSMLRFIRPCTILFWYDGHAPVGENWEIFTARVTAQNIRFEMLQITTPQSIWGKKIAYPEHKSDVIRFEALKNFGGMYLDSDVLIVRTTDPLRCFDFTMGRQKDDGLTNNVMFAVPQSPFLEKVIDNYKNYAQKEYAFNNVRYPSVLSRKFPQLIHVETDSINRPNFLPNELKTIFEEGCKVNLTSKYAIHLWNKVLPKHYVESANASTIKTMHSTFGQVARLVLYGETGNC